MKFRTSTRWYDTTYYVTYSTTVDLLRLDFSAVYSGWRQTNFNRPPDRQFGEDAGHYNFGSATQVEITASIRGSKSLS